MKFRDIDTGIEDSLLALYRCYIRYYDEFCDDYPTFTVYLLETILATINGRNDEEIIGLTPREISNIVIKLRKRIGQ